MTLLFIPGFMLDADIWRDVEPGLQAFGPILHADLSQETTIEALAARTLADAPARFVLVGFSMGGYVAREMARRAPDRVDALILVATSARGDRANQEARRATVVDRSNFSGLSRSAIVKSLHPERAGDVDMIERIRTMGQRLGPDAYIRQTAIRRRDETATLGEIRTPTLVIAGAQDALRSLEEAEELHRGIPGASMVVIEGTGHMIPIEAPVPLSLAIATWLERLNSVPERAEASVGYPNSD